MSVNNSVRLFFSVINHIKREITDDMSRFVSSFMGAWNNNNSYKFGGGNETASNSVPGKFSFKSGRDVDTGFNNMERNSIYSNKCLHTIEPPATLAGLQRMPLSPTPTGSELEEPPLFPFPPPKKPLPPIPVLNGDDSYKESNKYLKGIENGIKYRELPPLPPDEKISYKKNSIYGAVNKVTLKP